MQRNDNSGRCTTAWLKCVSQIVAAELPRLGEQNFIISVKDGASVHLRFETCQQPNEKITCSSDERAKCVQRDQQILISIHKAGLSGQSRRSFQLPNVKDH